MAYTHAKTHPTWLSLDGLNDEHMTNTTNVSFENISMENYLKISFKFENVSRFESRGDP